MDTFVQPSPFDADIKWIVRHSRMTDTLIFGPFNTLDEAVAWCKRNDISSMGATPLLPPRVEKGGYHGLWGGWKQ